MFFRAVVLWNTPPQGSCGTSSLLESLWISPAPASISAACCPAVSRSRMQCWKHLICVIDQLLSSSRAAGGQITTPLLIIFWCELTDLGLDHVRKRILRSGHTTYFAPLTSLHKQWMQETVDAAHVSFTAFQRSSLLNSDLWIYITWIHRTTEDWRGLSAEIKNFNDWSVAVKSSRSHTELGRFTYKS